MMASDELKALGEDIKKNGLQERVKFIIKADQSRKIIIDGRNRLAAMELAGVPVNDNHFEMVHHADIYAYVISANIHRRHLTREQKQELIAKVLKAQPGTSDRAIASTTKTDHKTVGAVRTKLEATGEIPQSGKTTGRDGRTRNRITVKAAPPPTPAQRVEKMIQSTAAADKKKHGQVSIERVMNDVVAAASKSELIVLANDRAPERHVPARARCEKYNIDWKASQKPLSDDGRRIAQEAGVTPEQSAEQRKASYAAEEAKSKSEPTLVEKLESKSEPTVAEKLEPKSELTLAEKLEPLLQGLFVEGQKNMATMSPGTVSYLVVTLERLLVEHGIVPSCKRSEKGPVINSLPLPRACEAHRVRMLAGACRAGTYLALCRTPCRPRRPGRKDSGTRYR
jgi:hypothetical protein